VSLFYEQTEESSNVGGRDIDILRPSAMTFVGTFDVSGSDRVKSRGGRDIYVRNALRSSSVVRYLWACGTEVASGCGLLLCLRPKGMGCSLPE
jgi:hypothetical protein